MHHSDLGIWRPWKKGNLSTWIPGDMVGFGIRLTFLPGPKLALGLWGLETRKWEPEALERESCTWQ